MVASALRRSQQRTLARLKPLLDEHGLHLAGGGAVAHHIGHRQQQGDLSMRADVNVRNDRDRQLVEAINGLLDIYSERSLPAELLDQVVKLLQRVASKDFTVDTRAIESFNNQPIANELGSAFTAATNTMKSVMGLSLQFVQESAQVSSEIPQALQRVRTAASTMQAAVGVVSDDNSRLTTWKHKSQKDVAMYAAALGEVCTELDGAAPASEQISSSIKEVALATGQVSTSVGAVADAVVQMSSSLNEVSSHSGQAANIARGAKDAAQHAATTMDHLGKSAKDIGKVVDLIRGIAS